MSRSISVPLARRLLLMPAVMLILQHWGPSYNRLARRTRRSAVGVETALLNQDSHLYCRHHDMGCISSVYEQSVRCGREVAFDKRWFSFFPPFKYSRSPSALIDFFRLQTAFFYVAEHSGDIHDRTCQLWKLCRRSSMVERCCLQWWTASRLQCVLLIYNGIGSMAHLQCI